MLTIPPFCPQAECRYHHRENIPPSERSVWYHKDGTYRPKNLNREVQRFVCTHCGKRFSAHTFSLDYGVQKHLSYRRIFDQLNSGSGIRSLARNLHVTDKVIINRVARLARQALALHALMRKHVCLREAVTADGFESFTGSQYFPNNIHIAVGKTSQYLYGLDYAPIRRKGRMTESQKKRREILEKRWKAPAGDISRSFIRLIRQIGRYGDKNHLPPVWIYTDEKREYRQVLRSIGWSRHVTIPSSLPRTRHNELFSVNYYDREFRKDQGNHVRQTVEFSRDVNNMMDRLWMYSAYHNYVKPFRVGVKGMQRKTHAEQAGIPPSVVSALWKYFFTQRFFVSHLDLSESEWYAWYRCYATPLKFHGPWYPRYAAA